MPSPFHDIGLFALGKCSRLGVPLAFALSSVSCGASQASLTQARPEFRAGAHHISVVGLFRRGRLDQATWAGVGPLLLKPFGNANCETAYAREFREAEPDTYAAFDRHIKEEGLSNEALALLTPYTNADLLVIFDVRDPRHGIVMRERKDPTDLPGRPQRSGHVRNRTHTAEPDGASLSAGDGFNFTASLFSVSDKRLVARVDSRDVMTLRGAAEDLATSLGKLVPGSTCTRWKWLENEQPLHLLPAAPSAEPSAAPPSAEETGDGASAGAPGE